MPADFEDTVAVLVPCYNAAEYIVQALDSAMAQTHPPTQIVIVEDGSTDNSRDIVKEYAKQRGNEGVEIVLIEQENKGEATSRNVGIAAATTKWIANLDADDWWELDKLEKQIEAANAAGPECVLVHTGGKKIFTDGRITVGSMNGPDRKVGWCTEQLIEPVAMGHPSVMYRRDAINDIGGYNPQYIRACDQDMYMRLSAVGTFAFVAEHLVNYRAHPNQLSAVPVEQIQERDRAIRTFFDAHPDKLEAIGKEKVEAALAEHLAIKLESLWWQRRLKEFRALLTYATDANLNNDDIEQWRKKSRWPNWLIRLKDRFDRGKSTNTEQSAAEGAA